MCVCVVLMVSRSFRGLQGHLGIYPEPSNPEPLHPFIKTLIPLNPKHLHPLTE